MVRPSLAVFACLLFLVVAMGPPGAAVPVPADPQRDPPQVDASRGTVATGTGSLSAHDWGSGWYGGRWSDGRWWDCGSALVAFSITPISPAESPTMAGQASLEIDVLLDSRSIIELPSSSICEHRVSFTGIAGGVYHGFRASTRTACSSRDLVISPREAMGEPVTFSYAYASTCGGSLDQRRVWGTLTYE